MYSGGTNSATGGGKFPAKVAIPPGLNRENYRTKICNFYKQGKDCPFGDKCFFAHGEKELRPFVSSFTYLFPLAKALPQLNLGGEQHKQASSCVQHPPQQG